MLHAKLFDFELVGAPRLIGSGLVRVGDMKIGDRTRASVTLTQRHSALSCRLRVRVHGAHRQPLSPDPPHPLTVRRPQGMALLLSSRSRFAGDPEATEFLRQHDLTKLLESRESAPAANCAQAAGPTAAPADG